LDFGLIDDNMNEQQVTDNSNHKAGFINIIGSPNVGKSTLMNALVGEKLSIITPKAQTTRHRILGIVNGTDYQIVYSDTPGILKPAYRLQHSMMKFVNTAVKDADLILYITDVAESRNISEPHNVTFSGIKKTGIPALLILNKIDLSSQDEVEKLVDKWHNLFPGHEVFPVSALHFFNLDNLVKRIIELLPVSPPYFDKEDLTDKPVRFFISEIIREKILNYYRKEIPYSVEVVLEEFNESENLVKIRSVIYVERESQKGILIGHKGEALKKVGIKARTDIEAFLGKKAYLELYVKVDKDWRNNEQKLKIYGYDT
jgi:GTP-binding protein Era